MDCPVIALDASEHRKSAARNLLGRLPAPLQNRLQEAGKLLLGADTNFFRQRRA